MKLSELKSDLILFFCALSLFGLLWVYGTGEQAIEKAQKRLRTFIEEVGR